MIDKEECVIELENVLQSFYEAKRIDDKKQIKYFQGMSKGMILILKKLEILNDDELKFLVKNVELEVPTIYREGK